MALAISGLHTPPKVPFTQDTRKQGNFKADRNIYPTESYGDIVQMLQRKLKADGKHTLDKLCSYPSNRFRKFFGWYRPKRAALLEFYTTNRDVFIAYLVLWISESIWEILVRDEEQSPMPTIFRQGRTEVLEVLCRNGLNSACQR